MTSLTARRRARHTTRGQSALLERVADTASRALRVAFYARVSTEEQADKETPRNQTEYMERKFAMNFAADSAEPWQLIGTFVDEGVSGTMPFENRPKGGELLRLARAGGVDLVVFLRLDRFGRRVTVIYDAAEQLLKHGVDIQSATEPWETRTPVGKLIFGLMAVLAEFERELIKDRFANGRDRHARADEFINGVLPFGYEVVEGKLAPSLVQIDELGGMTESELVEEIFTRIADKDTTIAIAKWLNALGVPSTKVWTKKSGERTTQQSREQWFENRISRMVRSSLYYGRRVLKHKSGPIEQQVAGLVSYDLWERANSAIGNSSHRGWQTRHRDMETYPYLLSGRLYCASCDLAMVGNKQRVRRDGTVNLYYCCQRVRGGREARRSGDCEGWSYVSGVQLEQWAIDDVDAFMADPAAATKRLRESVLERQGQQITQDTLADQLRLRLSELEASKPEVLRLLRNRRITEREADEGLEAIGNDIAKVRHQLERAETKVSLAESMEQRLVEVTTALQSLQDAWRIAKEDNDRAALQQIIGKLLGSVEVYADGRVEYHWLAKAPDESADYTKSFDYVDSTGTPTPVLTVPRILKLPARRAKAS